VALRQEREEQEVAGASLLLLVTHCNCNKNKLIVGEWNGLLVCSVRPLRTD
jgi:hypothetical protein